MNIFDFYGGKSTIENNITRALAICLEYDPAFAYAFLSRIMGEVNIDPNHPPDIDIHPGLGAFEDDDDIVSIFAVSLTSGDKFKEDEYEEIEARGAEMPITDMRIRIGNKLVICEVKKWNEDCRGQLKNQVEKVREEIEKGKDTKEIQEKYRSITWTEVIDTLESVKSLDKYQPHHFVENFYWFLFVNFPQWVEVKRLDEIDIEKDNTEEHINKRLQIIISSLLKDDKNIKLVENFCIEKDKCVLPSGQDWAEGFYWWGEEESKKIVVGCWLGLTKEQRENLFKKGQQRWEWLKWDKEKIEVMEYIFGDIEIKPFVMAAIYQRQIGEKMYFKLEEIKNGVLDQDNFHKISRRRHDWKGFDKDMLEVFSSYWGKSKYRENLKEQVKSSKNFDIKIGAQFYVAFDYAKVAALDKKDPDDPDSNEKMIKFMLEARDKITQIINDNKPPK